MLSTLLDTIKSQFGSKSYWLACMLPLILFVAANAAVARAHFPWIGALIPEVDKWDDKALKYGAALAVLLALAYIISTTTAVQLRMLEGSLPPLQWLTFLLCPAHAKALRKLDRAYAIAFERKNFLEDSRDRWLNALEQSQKAGKTAPPLSRKEKWMWRFGISEASRALTWVVFRQNRRLHIEPKRLQKAVAKLSVMLASHRTEAEGILHDAVWNLREGIQYAMDRYKFDVRELSKHRQTNFPGVSLDAPDPPENGVAMDILAPTRMGNIGRTIGTYPLVRYQMDLDIFWSRLQSSLQKDSKDYYATLQDSKVQVDAMVMMFWFSVVFTLFWTGALVLWLQDATLKEFLIVSISGTAAAGVFYILACEAYRIFADVMRACVDLMRFQVLGALHLSLPEGSSEERELWLKLGRATIYLALENFQYKHPASS